MTVRRLQFVTSLFALSFMGAANSSNSLLTAALTSGFRFALAVGVIGWLWSMVIGGVTFAIMRDAAPEAIVAHPKRHLITFLIDSSIFVLGLLAVTLCPTDLLGLVDGRAVAGAIFAAVYLGLLLGSMFMSYKDIVKEKLIAQGWTPPPGYDLTHGKNGTTPRPGNDSV